MSFCLYFLANSYKEKNRPSHSSSRHRRHRDFIQILSSQKQEPDNSEILELFILYVVFIIAVICYTVTYFCTISFGEKQNILLYYACIRCNLQRDFFT